MVPSGSPHTTSSATRVPRTWLSGCCKTTAVPPSFPKPTVPGRSTVPDVGARPASISIKVVFPDPLAPMIARCSPARTSRLTSRSASWPARG
ncbi:Uncharacterised protein [Mycobacterium tuberculosis]|uniref:Uncharacterized protein n=1 Tax=Mycobacterium tuberculosis TaxID=1773 RepID=A0A0U0T3Y2_MYCTX|nr:Uncharacterised protein [Mycobacterium tuberculosis]